MIIIKGKLVGLGLKQQLKSADDISDYQAIIDNPLNWLSVTKPEGSTSMGGKRKTRKNKKKIKRKLSRKK